MVLIPQSDDLGQNQPSNRLPLLNQRQRLNRLGLLGMCAAPIVGSFFYRYGYRLPLLHCPLRALTGIPCPTCGMTRSFTAIAQGDLIQAVQQHLFGPVVFLLLVGVIAHLIWELRFNQAQMLHRAIGKPILLYGAIGSYFSYYAVRLHGLEQSGALSSAFWISPAGLWFSRMGMG